MQFENLICINSLVNYKGNSSNCSKPKLSCFLSVMSDSIFLPSLYKIELNLLWSSQNKTSVILPLIILSKENYSPTRRTFKQGHVYNRLSVIGYSGQIDFCVWKIYFLGYPFSCIFLPLIHKKIVNLFVKKVIFALEKITAIICIKEPSHGKLVSR